MTTQPPTARHPPPWHELVPVLPVKERTEEQIQRDLDYWDWLLWVLSGGLKDESERLVW